jgi:hypothetical protein
MTARTLASVVGAKSSTGGAYYSEKLGGSSPAAPVMSATAQGAPA